VDPVGRAALEAERGEAGRQCGVRQLTVRAQSSAGLRWDFLAKLARAGCNPLESAVAGCTEHTGRIDRGAAAPAGWRKHQLECAPRELCEFAEDLSGGFL
jgi:hypothetical protein